MRERPSAAENQAAGSGKQCPDCTPFATR